MNAPVRRRSLVRRVRSSILDSLPSSTRQWLRKQKKDAEYLASGKWRQPFGDLRRMRPFRGTYGWGHGQCIDRYYIENFLAKHSNDVRGRVVEIADNNYTVQFGGDRVTQSDILHVVAGDPLTTIVGDLSDESSTSIPSDAFDCVILTQTLETIYELRSTIRNLFRILKPGGVLLATFPGIRNVSRYDADRWGEYWRFTTASATRLFTEVFPAANVEVASHGNLLTTISFLHGFVAEEMTREELDHHDPDFQLIITVRAVRPIAEVGAVSRPR